VRGCHGTTIYLSIYIYPPNPGPVQNETHGTGVEEDVDMVSKANKRTGQFLKETHLK
jgi:hypothetical protein